EILLSHAHWDHIQGLPHFKPFFAPGNTVRIWGTRQGTASLEAILRQQMDPAVFPVPLDALSASLTVQQVDRDEFSIGEFRVRTTKLRHPGTTLGFRLTPAKGGGGSSMAYVTDNELGPGGQYDVAKSWRRDFVKFLKDVDLLIHDAMYTPAELEQHRGWGHSTYEEAVNLAQDAGAKKLVLFHHEPEHGDKAMDGLVAAARKFAKTRGGSLDVERQEVQRLVDEQNLGTQGRVDPRTASKVGKLVGARYVVLGTFIDFYGDFRVDVRLVNTETGEIVKTESERMQRDHMFDIIRNIASRLMKDANLPALQRQASDQRMERQIPTEALTYYSRGLLYQDRGQKDKAAEMFTHG